MTEEEKLMRAPGCGSFIMLGLIGIILLSLVGLIFPIDLLPYPNEILIGVLIIASIALVVAFCIWRSKINDKKKDEDDKIDNLMRQRHNTLGHQDDEAVKLAEKYKESE